MDNFQHLKKDKWVIGVSGGADSMALLDMCRKNEIDCVVAHVNYKKRDSADRDMHGVQNYCEKYNISLEIKIVTEKEHGNFQEFARNLRYEFYKDIIEKYHCAGVLVAHQLDDVLETYLMQKKKNVFHSFLVLKKQRCYLV